MALTIIALVLFLALSAVALWAKARLRREERLPMQWSLNGEVTWCAPRPIALALIPVLSLPMFAAVILLPPRSSQESLVLPVLIGIGVTMIGIQRLHVWLIERAIRKRDG